MFHILEHHLTLSILYCRYCRRNKRNISNQIYLSLSELTYLPPLYSHWKRMDVSATQRSP